jgi:hypothetical protein
VLSINKKADERTRTAFLVSLQVGLCPSYGVPPRTGAWLPKAKNFTIAAPPVLLRSAPYRSGCSTVAVRSRS